MRAAIMDRLAADQLADGLEPLTAYLDVFPGQEADVRDVYAAFKSSEAAAETILSAPRRIGAYEILRQLGRGAQGTVHLAREDATKRLVAIKVLDAWHAFEAERLARFRREARMVAALHDQGICRYYQVGEEAGRPFLVMEYVRGESFAKLIEGGAKVESQVAQVVAWGAALARSLHHAHAAGVMHRDVKPANIIVRPNGQPVLLDFGLARRFDADASRVTMTGVEVGTPAYMAPERFEPDPPPADPRADVYALGVLLFEALAGKRPFEGGGDYSERIASIRRGRFRRLSDCAPSCSRDLELVVHKAMDRDPERRYQTAAAFQADLERIIKSAPVSAQAVPFGVRVQRFAADHPMAAVAFVCLSIALAVSLYSLDTARAQTRLADRRLSENQELIASINAQSLLRSTDPDLWRTHPETIALKEGWLQAAADLVTARGRFEAQMQALRQRGQRVVAAHAIEATAPRLAAIAREVAARPEGDPELDTLRQMLRDLKRASQGRGRAESRWSFADTRDQWRHDQLVELLATLDSIEDVERAAITPAAVRRQLERSRTIAAETVAAYEDAWQRCLESLRGDSRFAALALAPVLGLVPLGADPQSHLQEFAIAASGVVPERGGDGCLVLSEESAAVLVLVPGGRFVVGESAAEETLREVDLLPFLIGKHEVTQAQWRLAMSGNPSVYHWGHATIPVTKRHPVENVSWRAADLLAKRFGCLLPTEAQWEYAALAGSQGRYAWPCEALEDIRRRENLGDSSLDGRPGEWSDGFPTTAPVGTFTANAFGLFDVHGNVCEWCRDPYELGSPLRRLTVRGDGLSPTAMGDRRVFKGGSWYLEVTHAHARMRHRLAVDGSNSNLGLRLVHMWPLRD
ncbi:MAG: bifunctional serine/threonine-protein kinase/formylglycine-generating enzyme family protein [Planctomycetota bacterium]